MNEPAIGSIVTFGRTLHDHWDRNPFGGDWYQGIHPGCERPGRRVNRVVHCTWERLLAKYGRDPELIWDGATGDVA